MTEDSKSFKDGVILNAKTGAVVRPIDPASEITFACASQSYMQKLGCVLSLVCTSEEEVRLICYNQADNRIATIHNYGKW